MQEAKCGGVKGREKGKKKRKGKRERTHHHNSKGEDRILRAFWPLVRPVCELLFQWETLFQNIRWVEMKQDTHC